MKEYTRKNSLRLQGYDYSRAGTYFLTVCTKNSEMMFGEVKDGQMLLSEYGTVVKTILERTNQAYSNLALVCYTVMPNHIHMLVRIEDCLNNRRAAEGSRPYNAAASTFIHALKTLTTKKLGFSLWQRSYYDNIIHDDDEYETVKRYIENNAPTWEKDRFYCAH